jgi:hypothetical protein
MDFLKGLFGAKKNAPATNVRPATNMMMATPQAPTGQHGGRKRTRKARKGRKASRKNRKGAC